MARKLCVYCYFTTGSFGPIGSYSLIEIVRKFGFVFKIYTKRYHFG